jgi:hypothetical protein
MGAAQAMPADKYGFAPTPAIFAPGQKVQYDGVRTFAQIATHTIQANYQYFSMIGGIKVDVDMKAIGDLKSKDDIVKALAATFAFAHKAVANVTAENAFQSVRGVQTPASMFAGAIGHAEDEYGQAVEYLRMNAIVPPASETKLAGRIDQARRGFHQEGEGKSADVIVVAQAPVVETRHGDVRAKGNVQRCDESVVLDRVDVGRGGHLLLSLAGR